MPFQIHVDGRAIAAAAGQTVAAAMLNANISVFRRTAAGHPRGIFCGMGVCYDCVVTIDGQMDQRACMTPAAPGMRIETGAGALPAQIEFAHVLG